MPSTLGFINSKLLFCLLVTSILYHSAFVTSKPTGFSLRAVIDDSPESPLYLIENLTIAERLERLIKISYARVNYLNLVSSGDAKLVPDNIRIPMLRDAVYYAVAFTIGSQGHPVKLLMDTGGGLIWTQCLPCTNCFPQKLPIYNPAASTSYATATGDSTILNMVVIVCTMLNTVVEPLPVPLRPRKHFISLSTNIVRTRSTSSLGARMIVGILLL
ncbi:aspartic proteinase nepenthesin-1-like [Gossypium arboreum]|uniref:Peptidase A1 domain-containing protein n=1 Tax=Gossypium arboreum TaxID=29729 RepID=A0ABR0MH77_GOSAR|nr:aspartic proteinase nepenthesin-1-like [Gossypium arboreum]KAK5772493.1 hypothetical protein PVK06_048782 [Gossypium arboreum]